VPAEDLIEGDEVIVTVTNAAFANANAGTWTVSADVSIDNGNYSLTSGAASDEAEILPKELTASIVAEDKTYDGNTDAIATGSVPAGDVIEGDEVIVTVTNAAFSEANAGLRTVTADVSIANPNYSLTLGTANVDAEIYAKELTASIVAQDKTYDGNTDAVATGSVPEENLIEGDEVIVTVTNAAFANANAGTWTVSADVSIDNGNYSLTSGAASDEAEIFAKELTASIVAED
ncbi:YDG domain-containing protein, partial [Algoriphagus boritolerans]|uniref:YDG domain-containing protein n=1 Tax=Algoriphagus boritolerans TaxID=308111 RepID=UPI000A58E01F